MVVSDFEPGEKKEIKNRKEFISNKPITIQISEHTNKYLN